MLQQVYELDEARHSPHVARKRKARMREILRVALDIASEGGRESLTLTRVAQRQGLTTAALYRYFPSKDALVAELQRAVILALATITQDRVAEAGAFADRIGLSTAERALLGVVVSGFVFEEFSRAAPVEFGILSMDLSAPEFRLPDREAAHVFEAAWSALSNLAEQLRFAGECGALDAGDESERALALWAGLQGVVQTRKLARSAPDRIDSTRIARGLVTALLVGWGAPSDMTNRLVDLTRAEQFAELADSAHRVLEKRID